MHPAPVQRWSASPSLVATGLLLILLVATSCDDAADSRGAAPVETDSAGIKLVVSGEPQWPEGGTTALAEVAAPSLTIGEEDGEEILELHRVSDVHRLGDGSIAVMNSGSHEIRIFDAAGRHLRNVGRKGEGPGEFSEFSSPRIHDTPSGFLADDNGPHRVHLYDHQFGFTETRRFTLTNDVPRPFLRGVFNDGSWLAIAADGGGGLGGTPGTVIEMGFAILHYDDQGAFIAELGRFAGAKRLVHEHQGTIHYPYIPFSTEALLVADGDGFVVFRGDKPELEYRDKSGRLVRLVRWPRERVPSAQAWPEYRDRSVAGLATSDQRTRVMYGAYYAKDLPLPEFAPLYSAMKVDADRAVWLQRFRMPGDTTARAWDVIAGNGAWLGTVRTPPRLTVHRIGKDYVLGRELDSLGVERVRQYPLRWSELP